jgi:hypothetical protein
MGPGAMTGLTILLEGTLLGCRQHLVPEEGMSGLGTARALSQRTCILSDYLEGTAIQNMVIPKRQFPS